MKYLIPWSWRNQSLPVRRVEVPSLWPWNRTLEGMVDSFWENFGLSPHGTRERQLGNFSPRLDVEENEKEYLISAELPGMDEKDIDLSIDNNMLTVKGDKKEEKEGKQGDYHLVERHYGSFSRSFELPEGIDAEKVEAHFKKGVLRISLPKTPQAQKEVKKITIKAA
jgi:HSP20 family protein